MIIISVLGVLLVFLALCYLVSRTGKSSDLIACDLCPQMINAKTGRHPKSIGIGYGEFHNVHLYRRYRGEPLIQGNWKELEMRQKLKAAAEKEHDKAQELQLQYDTIMNQPVGEKFLETLDIP